MGWLAQRGCLGSKGSYLAALWVGLYYLSFVFFSWRFWIFLDIRLRIIAIALIFPFASLFT
jgi:hypothetical protein